MQDTFVCSTSTKGTIVPWRANAAKKLPKWRRRPWTGPLLRLYLAIRVALARRAMMHCAAISMKWDVLCHAVMALARLPGDGSQFWNQTTGRPLQMNTSFMQNISKLDNERKDRWKWRKGRDPKMAGAHMLNCMDRARAFECRNDRGCVLALLGIFNRGRDIPFEAHYQKSVAEVYEAFARYCLRYGDTVDVLAWAGVTNLSSMQERLEVPS